MRRNAKRAGRSGSSYAARRLARQWLRRSSGRRTAFAEASTMRLRASTAPRRRSVSWRRARSTSNGGRKRETSSLHCAQGILRCDRARRKDLGVSQGHEAVADDLERDALPGRIHVRQAGHAAEDRWPGHLPQCVGLLRNARRARAPRDAGGRCGSRLRDRGGSRVNLTPEQLKEIEERLVKSRAEYQRQQPGIGHVAVWSSEFNNSQADIEALLEEVRRVSG